MFRSQKPRADEVIFSEEKFQKPLLINFFAWEKKLCLLLHGLPPQEELDPPRLHCIGESVTEKAVASIQMPKPAGGHWMRPSQHSTEVHSGNEGLAWECQTNRFPGNPHLPSPPWQGRD